MHATTGYYETKIKVLTEAIDRVRQLHFKVNGPYDDYMCSECYVDEYQYQGYPCPTIKALEGEK